MRKKYVHALALWMGLAIANSGVAQTVGVNATGAPPNVFTILELNTGNTFTPPNGKGLLTPDVALTPATVYNTTVAGSGGIVVTPGHY